MHAMELAKELDLILKEIPTDNQNTAISIYTNYCINKIHLLLDKINKEYPDTELNSESALPLVHLLQDHFNIVKQTDLCPPHSPSHKVTIAFLILAQTLEPILNINRYELLMPTLEALYYEASATNLDDTSLTLDSFILSDDNKRIIEIIPTLEFAIDDSILKHTSLINGQMAKLSEHEAQRVINYSQQTKELWNTLKQKNELETKGLSFGAALKRLANALKLGGAYQRGKEMDSGEDANAGIVDFHYWVESLNEEEKNYLFNLSGNISMEEIYGRLTRPAYANYQDSVYCVQSLSGHIETILNRYPELYNKFPKTNKYASHPDYGSIKQQAIDKLMTLKKTFAASNHSISSSYGSSSQKTLEENISNIEDFQSHVSHNDFISWIYLTRSQSEENQKLRMRKILTNFFFKQDNISFFFRNISIIPEEERLAFILERIDKIQDAVQNGSWITECLSVIPTKHIKTLLKKISEHISKNNQWEAILDELSKDQLHICLKLITPHISSFEQMNILIYKLGTEKKRAHYAKRLDHLVSTSSHVISISKLIPSEMQMDYIFAHKKLFTDIYDITHHINSIPVKNRLLFALVFQHLITTDQDLYRVKSQLSYGAADALEKAHQRPLNNGIDLAELYNGSYYDQFLVVAYFFQRKIQDAVELKTVVSKIKNEDRLSFIMSCMALLKNINDIILLLKVLTEKNDRLTLATDCESQVASHLHLSSIISILDPQHRMGYVMKFLNKINDGNQLANIMEHLTPDERFQLASNLAKRIRDGYELANVLALLALDQRFPLINSCKHIIQGDKQAAIVANQLMAADAFKLIHSLNGMDANNVVKTSVSQSTNPSLLRNNSVFKFREKQPAKNNDASGLRLKAGAQ